MKAHRILLAALFTGLTALESDQPKNINRTVNDLVVVEGQNISGDQVREIEGAAQLWDAAWDCGRRITVRRETPPKANKIEEANAGWIVIYKMDDVRNTVLHAMTHACKPKEPWILEEPMAYPEGQITSYHGLSLKVTLNGGRSTQFNLFEEALAERVAASMGGYISYSRGYYELARFHMAQFPSVETGMKQFRNNDVPGYVRSTLNLPDEHAVTEADIWRAMQEHQKLYEKR